MKIESSVPMRPSAAALLPIMAVVFLSYLVTGLAMPVLPLHVHGELGFGTFVVGLVAGSQFAASLISRLSAGRYADGRGPRRAIVLGLLLAAASGLLYLISLQPADAQWSVAILLSGRALLGVAESFIITGALSWGLRLMGPSHTGKTMAWIGSALYAAFAVGAPAGTALYTTFGFGAVAVAATLIPLLALPLVTRIQRVATPKPETRSAFADVARAVWMPGLGVALSGVGFAAITTFIALLFVSRGWNAGWLAFTALSIAFIVGRVCFGHLPDRIGGAKVALVCVFIEAFGQALIWLAPSVTVALIGVTLTGLGYSLIYPGFGVEALRRAPAQSRGVTMAAYTVFLDLTLGLASPALGLVAGANGLASVFLVSAVVVLGAAAVAARLLFNRRSTVRIQANAPA